MTKFPRKIQKKPVKHPPTNKEIGSITNCLTGDLKIDLDNFKGIFHYPKNKDFIVRPIYINSLKLNGVLFYMKGTICTNTLTRDIILPLMDVSPYISGEDAITEITNNIITNKNVKTLTVPTQITTNIVKGSTILLIEGYKGAISFSTADFEHRPIEKPVIENTIKGPKESFIECADVNCSLIRKYLKCEELITEEVEVGVRGKDAAYMMYVEGVSDPDLIYNIRNRINNINTDNVLSISILEQFIEDRSYSLLPTMLYTERPDRAAAFLLEGHVILIMDGSPACLIAPATFWTFFHSAEDQYQRMPYGNFIRTIRFIALFITLLVPGLYVAITSFHVEMIPSDLAVSIAAAREVLPFPVITEVLLMEISFELIREAGVRVPTTIGPTIGIVGALILGQAAVEANIVSPILVIIVALTGLSSFTIPDVSLNYAVRISRFIFVAAGAFMGFLGISICLSIYLTYVINTTTFGVPFLSPVAPHYPSSTDTLFRDPIWKQWLRPFNISSLDPRRKGSARK
ncbi:MAG: spore germination protein [Epulopiscium sp.]|nr:spore germination protein [Candidatus Epulonipiscium sp.]